MTIRGIDLPPGVLAERYLDRHHQQLVRREYGERWECDCEEYRTVKPNTARAYCEHTQRCGVSAIGSEAVTGKASC
jgi:hypothetical protein